MRSSQVQREWCEEDGEKTGLEKEDVPLEAQEGLADGQELKVEEPEARQAGIKVESISELVDKLKNEAKVI